MIPSTDDPAYKRLLASLARRGAEADRLAAPLLMRQLAEDDLIRAKRIDPTKGEYLAAFGLRGDDFVCEIHRPVLPPLDLGRLIEKVKIRLRQVTEDLGDVLIPEMPLVWAGDGDALETSEEPEESPNIFQFVGEGDDQITIEVSQDWTSLMLTTNSHAKALALRITASSLGKSLDVVFQRLDPRGLEEATSIGTFLAKTNSDIGVQLSIALSTNDAILTELHSL